MTTLAWIVGAYAVLGALWAGAMALMAIGAKDPLSLAKALDQFALWPWHAWRLMGPW